MSDLNQYVLVNTSIDSEDKAIELSKLLVEAKLAACVHMVPIKSTYRWQGAVESADEIVVSAKTRATLSDRVIDFIKSNHSYDVPEIIVTPIIDGHRAYLDWIEESTETAD